MKINGQTAVYGIIGNPIRHTSSPAIHNHISEAMGIDAVYVPFVANDDLAAVIPGLYSLGVRGLNVTVPYKSDVMEYLAGVDEMAGRIGAVNTLKYTEKGYYGYNTDILGLGRELDEEGISLKERDVVILGAGGAARAVAFLSALKGAASLTIVNRTEEKALGIKKDVSAYADIKGMHSLAENTRTLSLDMIEDLGGKDYIVFQCTNVGLSPRDDECVLNDEAFYKKVAVGVDLIYKPAVTRFMKYVEDAGGKAVNGLKMLIYQAVSAYEIWNDVRVPESVVSDIERELK